MKNLTALSMRVIAVFLVLANISTLSTIIPMAIAAPEYSSIEYLPMAIGPVSMVAAGIVILIFAESLSSWLYRPTESDEELSSLDSPAAAKIGTGLLGLYLVATSIPGLIVYFFHPEFISEGSKTDHIHEYRELQYLAGFVAAACKALIGAFLIFFSRRVSKLLV